MNNNLFDKLPLYLKKYKIEKIDSGASKRLFFRIKNNKKSFICMDSSKEKKEYYNYIKIHSYLSKTNITVPKIYENYDNFNLLIMEDLGNLRFDKILNNYKLKNLLSIAVKTLITIKNEISTEAVITLSPYNFKILKKEISEIADYYFPFVNKKKISKGLENEFYDCWKNYFYSNNFNFNNFVHKDFNINNLLYLPSKKNQFKCGVVDFQSAFRGESCWDLFSLLEDSRILFDNSFNDFFIKYYYQNTNQNDSLDQFKEKYYTLNLARQTRLMGRWVKLYEKFNDKTYLKFMPVTKKRLLQGLKKIKNKDLITIYNKLI